MILFGIEAQALQLEQEVSPAVTHALPGLCEQVLQEILEVRDRLTPNDGRTSLKVVPETLRTVRFLKDLTEDEPVLLAGIREVQEMPPGAVVFREGGQRAARLPGAGGMRVVGDPGARSGSKPDPDGWFGRAAGLVAHAGAKSHDRDRSGCQPDPDPRAARAATHGPEQSHPSLGLELMRRTALALAQRLAATRLQLLDVYRHELPVVPEDGGPE